MGNDGSELIECIKIAIADGEMPPADVAASVGMTRQALHEFLTRCRGTQVQRVEQILDAIGYEIVIRRKR